MNIFVVIACAALLSASATALAYRLPACNISNEERTGATEDVLSGYKKEFGGLSKSVNIRRIDEHRRNPKIRLTGKERKAAKKYDELIVKIGFWDEVVRLKSALAALHGENRPAEVAAEADLIAKDVIETVYAVSQKWRVGGSALFANFLVNVGLKKEGLCYHYVAKLRDVLLNKNQELFDVRWGTAWAASFRENNALVITAKAAPFEEGLVIDAWRRAGRPFWTPVKGDKYPWVETLSAEERYDLE